MPQELTATEAAARLGVKKETLYAYVSRGILTRRKADVGRASVFDADEVDALRTGRRRAKEGELDTVISTAITQVRDGELRIRGRDLVASVDAGASYEETVDWLWGGEAEEWELPTDVERAVRRVQKALPVGSPPIDRLRVAVATVSATDSQRFDSSAPGVRRAGRALLLAMAAGLPALGSGGGGGVAGVLWPRLTRRRAKAERLGALDAALALLADHGLASSTFAARIAASVRADPYSIVVAGLGVVGGTMHGAASAGVHRLLMEAHRLGAPARAVGELHKTSARLPGFGHAVYELEDPRCAALMSRIAQAWSGDARLDTATEVSEIVARRTELAPNVDFALGALTWLADMEPDAGEAIFAISRTAGWIAHGLEEIGEPALRFRPRARYTGLRGA